MTQAQQPEALILACALRAESERTNGGVKYSTAKNAAKELERQHARIAELEDKVAEGKRLLRDETRATLAATPAAQAQPVPDEFGTAEHWKEKAQYWAGVAHKLRGQALRGEPVDGIVHPEPRAQDVQRDAANWRHVLRTVRGLKTSEYERLCDIFDVPHDGDFSAAIAAQAAQGEA